MSAILPDYKNRVEILADVYGASSLLVKPYSKEVIPGMILSPLLDGEWCRKAHENAHPFVGQNVSLECSTAGNNRSMTSTQLRLLYGFNYYSKSLPERYSHPKANVFRRLVAEYPSLSTRFTIDYQLKQEAITASLQSFQYLRSHFGIDLLSSSGSASLSSGDDNTVDVIDSGNILFVNDDMLNFLSWSIDRLGLSVNCDLKKINRSDQICSILYDFL